MAAGARMQRGSAASVVSALSNLQAPTLIVHGQDDPMPLESSRETADTMGASLVVIENAGHAPHVERTAEFTAALDAFLPAT